MKNRIFETSANPQCPLQYKIRELKDEDNEKLEKVIRSCLVEFGANHEGTVWADPELGSLSSVYQEAGTRYWIAENTGGEILGGVGIGRLEGVDDTCELQKMYCIPQVRGTGISHKLIDTALRYAKQYYANCYLETLDNMIAAHKFYEKKGFKRIDQRIGNTGHVACGITYIIRLS
ncbi:MAG: GNAT family N-acetyltransferase [Oscillospiraceae bacterium]|nr:GNAT family N-acetyltransferase [Oscillospiraceae bacterium]